MKIKNLLIISGLLCLIATLCACNLSKPEDMSDEAYNAGLKVVEITDKYLDSEITREEAYEQINEIAESLPSDDIMSIESKLVGSLTKSIALQLDLEEDDSTILDSRNKIAKYINLQPRTQ